MNKIRRICLFAGPGAGKSTLSALIFGNLKHLTVSKNYSFAVELVQEYIKNYAYEKRKINPWTQTYVFAKQLNREYIPLSNGVDLIVTDSPLFLSCVYAKKYNTPGYEHLFALAKDFDAEFPSLNIFIRRGERKYVQNGRYESYEQALEIDNAIEQMLIYNNINYHNINHGSHDFMASEVLNLIKKYCK